jgi:Flavin containing amine oxidoreductase/PHD-like zinc-binding domain
VSSNVQPDNASSSPTKRSEDKRLGLKKTDAPSHRHSSDMSIDIAIARAIQTHKFRDFSKLTKDEHVMLEWNMKNVEYALGANVSDLSMKFWDSDERHAFEGDHVLLREGYSSIVDYMVQKLEQYGEEKFKAISNFPIGKVQYARRSTTEKYSDRKQRKLVELSDACCVIAEDERRSIKCDFVVCTLPLGVLKHAVEPSTQSEEDTVPKVVFEPPLPESKRDTINTVGFGLLDKLYLQFADAFWREPLGLQGDKYLFGNSSGLHSHYYMFTDVGLTLGTEKDSPPILMTLISGKEAVHCEMLSEEEMVQEVLETLSELLKPMKVPPPVAVRRTKWGSDRFSRGCYTFLPPGATDQDFSMLQSPINGNGDSLLLEGSETMRMFFAGEHTTALHPSMAHGAMLSGIRAAKEIISTLSFNFRNDKTSDRLIPVALFRRDNPTIPLQCSLCHEMGSRVREGSLLALKRGARQVLVHNNCAEYSPEVEVYEGQWNNVIRAVNRGKALDCALCERSGATIGCTHINCFRVYHFSCSEDTGWRFDREGKVFYCDLHRKTPKGNEADRVSLHYYKTKTPYAVFKCCLCGGPDDDEGKVGKLLAFQYRNRRVLVHEKCARYTTIVDTKEDTESRMGIEFANIFEAIDKAGTCVKCQGHGATIGCASCDRLYHFPCATDIGWKAEKRGSKFLCESHVKNRHKNGASNQNGGSFQHALFSGMSAMGGAAKSSLPSNEFGTNSLAMAAAPDEIYISDNSSDSGESVQSNNPFFTRSNKDMKLKPLNHAGGETAETKKVKVTRKSVKAPWNINLAAKKEPDGYVLKVGNRKGKQTNSKLEEGQLIKSIDGLEVGTESLDTFKEVLTLMEKKIEILIEVVSDESKEDSKPAAVPSDPIQIANQADLSAEE